MKKDAIIRYSVETYRPVHRNITQPGEFGYSAIQPVNYLPGFEIYSKQGIRPAFGPVIVNAYRLGFTTSGSVEVDLGLNTCTHHKGIITITAPGSIFSYRNPSADYSGYYCLFDGTFLEPMRKNLEYSFPFFDAQGVSSFLLSNPELAKFVQLMWEIDGELKADQADKRQAVQHYLSLMLIAAKRAYQRQMPQPLAISEPYNLVAVYTKLVSLHFLQKRKVADYATMMNVTPNHLNKIIKQYTNQTASSKISQMLLLEAKARLRYTQQSIAELAYELGFSDPSAFNRFFKKQTNSTPLSFRTSA
ncbi:helix-turn-helix domain-containing protein [Spirosoma koreense]